MSYKIYYSLQRYLSPWNNTMYLSPWNTMYLSPWILSIYHHEITLCIYHHGVLCIYHHGYYVSITIEYYVALFPFALVSSHGGQAAFLLSCSPRPRPHTAASLQPHTRLDNPAWHVFHVHSSFIACSHKAPTVCCTLPLLKSPEHTEFSARLRPRIR